MKKVKSELSITVIVTTYNRPHALKRVLDALSNQSYQPQEVVVADDGSTSETREVIEKLAEDYPCKLTHVWQADEDFRAAKARNSAVANSTGEYLIFIDGDCLCFPSFVEIHTLLSEPKKFVVGNRILLSKVQTKKVEFQNDNILEWPKLKWLTARLLGRINRLLPLIKLPFHQNWRNLNNKKWQGAQTCNLAMFRTDFLSVNGFDESYIGWGHEDADLVVRLIKSGVARKEGKFALPVLHLWHEEAKRDSEKDNLAKLKMKLDKQ